MKRCPQCNRVEADDTLVFCRSDGVALINDSGQVSSEIETSLLPHTSTAPEIHRSTGPTTALPATQLQTSTRKLTKTKRRGLAYAIVAVFIVASLVLGFSYWSRKRRTRIESIAVMPFVNESGNPDVEYLSDGMTDTLISSLSQIPNLSVKARSTVFAYKGKEVTPKKIGEELGVESVLLGRVGQRGEDVKLSLELVNVQTQNVIWSGLYNRKQGDLVTLQSDIARDVLSKLQARLSGADEQKVLRTQTTNSEAYQLYLRGRYYWNKRTAENLRKAMDQFQRAADTDPNYALAYAGLADCFAVLGDYTGVPEHETIPKTRAFAERALQLDSSLVEAQTALAYTYSLAWQWDQAEKEFKRALELNPNYATAHHWYSLRLLETGRVEESVKEIKRAQELDPVSPIISYNMALSYLFLGDTNSSIEQSKRLIDLDPNFPRGHQVLGQGYLKQSRYPEALAEFKKAVSLSPNDRQALRDLGYGYAVSGKRVEARGVLEQLLTKHEKGEAFASDIAGVYAGLGDKDQAFSWLEKDFRARTGRLSRIRYHIVFESLRDDPRYADLLRRMGSSS